MDPAVKEKKWEQNSDEKSVALIKNSDIFNHSYLIWHIHRVPFVDKFSFDGKRLEQFKRRLRESFYLGTKWD